MTDRDSDRLSKFPAPGEIISYLDMCRAWGVSFQRGMHYRLKENMSVILMSRRRDAPYRDHIEEDGRVLIYEGHDLPKHRGSADPKSTDQPRENPGGSLTQNGLFERGVLDAKKAHGPSEVVAVYEKIHRGIWAFNGIFQLTDAWQEADGKRNVFKFRLELTDSEIDIQFESKDQLEHTRLIPSAVKLEVWKRDKGRCVMCSAKDNLHFDHDVPYSKGGTSLKSNNIRLLCARHNLSKSDKIQ